MKKPATKKDYMEIASIAFDVNVTCENIQVHYNFYDKDGDCEAFISLSAYDKSIGEIIFSHYIGDLDSNLTADQAINLLSSFLPEAK